MWSFQQASTVAAVNKRLRVVKRHTFNPLILRSVQTKIIPTVVFFIALAMGIQSTQAASVWVVRNGDVTLHLDRDVLMDHGLTIRSKMPRSTERDGSDRNDSTINFTLANSDEISFYADFDTIQEWYASTLTIAEGIQIVSRHGSATVYDFQIIFDQIDQNSLQPPSPENIHVSTNVSPYLELHGFRAGFNPVNETMIMPSEAIRISSDLARILGDEHLAGLKIGRVVARSNLYIESGHEPLLDNIPPIAPYEGSVAGTGGDMTFCQLYGLAQYGRSGDVVGLAVATTSWNVGTSDLEWYSVPNNNHPFIAMNLYRLEEDRFEQIGQSWVKHGFFALGSEQCGTACTYQPGHAAGNWLGVGCTDTYSSGLNASQSNLGPRYEINPWTGWWLFNGSHLNFSHSHDGQIEHRIQVHDDDLDPVQHPSVEYYTEGYYVVHDDLLTMNNAAWKPVTVAGSPGGTWNLGMSSASNPPTIGFAIDAWTDARQTVIAEEVPPKKSVSPDGRCLLAAKSSKINLKQWHYEYAVLNIDMDRKVQSFSIPLSSDTSVNSIGFSAVQSHGEPYSNTPWTSSVANGAITWSTVDNPIRWGTLYNFWFNANTPPFDTDATLGLYEPGTPDSVSGITTGPDPTGPLCLPLDPPTGDDTLLNKNRYISFHPGNQNQSAAIRVRMKSLMHPENPQGGEPDFTPFEDQIRWVGPPAVYLEGVNEIPVFTAAGLQCDPYYMDWGGIDLLAVYGAEIIPSSSYEVQLIHESCSNLSNEANYTPPLSIATLKWGDIVPPYITDLNITSQPDIRDILSVVDKFLGFLNPIKTRSQLQPNIPLPGTNVGIAEVLKCVDAWLGTPYPFEGPTDCP